VSVSISLDAKNWMDHLINDARTDGIAGDKTMNFGLPRSVEILNRFFPETTFSADFDGKKRSLFLSPNAAMEWYFDSKGFIVKWDPLTWTGTLAKAPQDASKMACKRACGCKIPDANLCGMQKGPTYSRTDAKRYQPCTCECHKAGK
jgi:hypothetical protein